ncbi:MAG: TldD/PmbA family protein, partial [Chloroflexi bacterium]|nr:TldD/PmbA family protein [Chloroflexota bacterium]
MRDAMTAAIRGHNCDYIELRIEESELTHVRFRGRELDEIGHSTGIGGCVRAAVKGGWGFVCFNDLSDLREKAALAVRQAALVGAEKTVLAPVAPVEDVVPPHLPKDARAVPLAEKKRLLDEYNEIILGTPQVLTSQVMYWDGHRKVIYANGEGTFIQQERQDVNLRVSAMARDGGDVQQAGVSIGSLGDFKVVEGLHGEVRELAHKAVEMLSAPRVKGGEYTLVLDPVLAGVFIHEAFGHLSEADHVYQDPRMRELMVLGKRFGGPILNVVDGAAIPGLRGSFLYDDEGTSTTRTYLIREGVLVGRLHSRETAAKMDEKPTGNARAINHRFPPIVRMTNTLIEPGQGTLEDLLADIKEGVYVRNWYGGMTSMEQFTFSAGEASMV